MHLFKQIFVLYFLCLLCFSCNEPASNNCGSAWLGGEVVNPKGDYVIINRSRKVIDTIPLDENNFFLYQMENVDPGIYFFNHSEFQALYIEPGDSLMLRVNTREFDESLSFTGKGAPKNNLMMDLFLQNERENPFLPGWYMLSPLQFEGKMDSISANKKQMLREFISKRKPSDLFIEIATASIDYNIYLKKELYISANSRKRIYNEEVDIPESFYAYRKTIDFGNEYIRSYYPYYRYLSFYMDNLAFEQYKGKEPYDRDSFIHNYIKAKLIDSLITHDSLKNSLLRSSASKYFVHAKDEENEQKMLDRFLELNTNPRDQKEIKELANATIQLTPGHQVPNLKLLTTQNTVRDLHSTLKRPSVLYFWSNKSIKHYREIHTRAQELHSKYPEYDFIGINIDSHFKKWLKTVVNSGYEEITEYQFENFSDAEMQLVIDSVNKAMILDEDGTILNGNTNIFEFDIEAELLVYLNQ